MTIWVVGSGGLLGSAFCKAYPGKVIKTVRGQVDISDLDSVYRFIKKNPKITRILNCAAFSLVDLAETNRLEAKRANAIGPENLGKIAQEMEIPLIHISTDYVFPGTGKTPLKEEDLTGPVNYYGETKLEGEERLMAVCPSSCVIRTSWIFGEGGKNFVANLWQMLQQKEEILLSDDQWGRPTYAPDLACAIFQMFGRSGIYHYANKGIATKFSFGVAMKEVMEKKGHCLGVKRLSSVSSSVFPSPCKRPVYSVFDTSKIEQILSIRSWQEALYEFCEQRKE